MPTRLVLGTKNPSKSILGVLLGRLEAVWEAYWAVLGRLGGVLGLLEKTTPKE